MPNAYDFLHGGHVSPRDSISDHVKIFPSIIEFLTQDSLSLCTGSLTRNKFRYKLFYSFEKLIFLNNYKKGICILIDWLHELFNMCE